MFLTESDSKNGISRSRCVDSRPGTGISRKLIGRRPADFFSNFLKFWILYFQLWTPELVHFHLKIGFLTLKSVFWQLETSRFWILKHVPCVRNCLDKFDSENSVFLRFLGTLDGLNSLRNPVASFSTNFNRHRSGGQEVMQCVRSIQKTRCTSRDVVSLRDSH